VLVVEDDPDVRAYVVETLMALNYRVREAANGKTHCICSTIPPQSTCCSPTW